MNCELIFCHQANFNDMSINLSMT